MVNPNLSEQFLRKIWQEQLFSLSHLQTSTGKPVSILSPGMPNEDGGPDFHGARIQIGNITFFGDVEIHKNAAEWESHQHDQDSHYNRVILHVVCSADPLRPPAQTKSRRFLPVLMLHPFLDDKLCAQWIQDDSKDRNVQPPKIACCESNDGVGTDIIFRWLNKLASQRMELKVRRCEERLKQLVDEDRAHIYEPYPRYYASEEEVVPPSRDYNRLDFTPKKLWEQLLYEGLMEAMGYSKNVLPFVRLAKSVRLETLRQLDDEHSRMAVLFGAAGLLPSVRKVSEKESRVYVRALRSRWKELRCVVNGELLNEGDWLFFRLRPSNFPTARLATMCFLIPSLFHEEAIRDLVGGFREPNFKTEHRLKHLYTMFAFTPDEFWKSHYLFTGTGGRHGVSLGKERIEEIIVNAIIPILFLYARIFNERQVGENARNLLSIIPPSRSNRQGSIIQNQLLKKKGVLKSALLQQGALQLLRGYCAPARCEDCAIGNSMAPANP